MAAVAVFYDRRSYSSYLCSVAVLQLLLADSSDTSDSSDSKAEGTATAKHRPSNK